jgi:hypothetical protein
MTTMSVDLAVLLRSIPGSPSRVCDTGTAKHSILFNNPHIITDLHLPYNDCLSCTSVLSMRNGIAKHTFTHLPQLLTTCRGYCSHGARAVHCQAVHEVPQDDPDPSMPPRLHYWYGGLSTPAEPHGSAFAGRWCPSWW